MIKPILVVVWPVHVDYPIFRYNLRRFQKWFDNIVVAFSNLNQEDNYRAFIAKDLPFVTFVPANGDQKDWRDNAVNSALNRFTNTGWYMFLEQDFLIKDDRFFEVILNTPHDARFVYYKEDERLHPGCALVAGDLVSKTSKDFSANPPLHDHFGLFFKEIQSFTEGQSVEELGLVERQDFYHLAGLTQNYACFKDSQPFFKPKEFITYNSLTLEMMEKYIVPVHDNFFHTSINIAVAFGREREEKFLEEFFPKEVRSDGSSVHPVQQ